MRAANAVLVALALLSAARVARATPPITQDWRATPQVPAADTSREAVARQASSIAYSTTNTGVLIGLGCMLGGASAKSGGVFLVGAMVAGAGIVLGPPLGWDRAGYQGRGAVSALVRLGIIGGAMAIPLSNGQARDSEFGPVVVFLAGLTGLTVACVEGYVECSEVGPFVREHGPGPGRVGLGPAVSPSGAPVLALRLRFK